MKFSLPVSIFLLIFCSVILSERCHAQGEALKYLENIDSQFENISSDMWDYSAAVAHGKSARKVEKRRKEVLASMLDAQNKVKKMTAFEGDKSLRDSVLSYLKLDYNVMNNDYAKIVDMEEIAEQSYDAMEAYLLAQEKATLKLHAASDMLNAQQKTFAAAHNITLIDSKDKIGQKLEAAGIVFKYYNVVYLIFFKSYKQEAYMIDALNKNDLNALKQNADALIKTATEGLKKVDSVKPYNGDGSIKTACQEMLKFYKTEATKDCPVLVAYSVKKENYDKLKKAYDGSSNHTQADVNEINKASTDLNKAGVEYQKVNDESNKKRSDLINKWTESVARFLDKQVPSKK
ncbi:MAG: hypothetical protein ACHQRM_16335 [Bacteroidia bacterium]